MKLTWLVLAFLAIIVHVTFGEMTPRRVQSPRVKRESIRHDSSPTAFDRTHSELQAPASQPARYVRGARPDPLVIPVPGVATVTIVTDGTGIPKTSWTPEQSAAVVSYFSKVGTAEPPTFQEYQDMIALFDTRMTSPAVPAGTVVGCLVSGTTRTCTYKGDTIAASNVRCRLEEGETETCRTINALPEEEQGFSKPEIACIQHGYDVLYGARYSEETLAGFRTMLDNSVNVLGARRRRQTESFSRERSQTPSGFRSQPVKRSADPHNLPGQGRALQRK